MMLGIGPDARLDCRGLFCPEPVIRTAERVKGMEPGEVLEVVGTDPGLAVDIPAYCISHGHRFLGCERKGGEIACTLEVLGRDQNS
jgi:tRNA 2-thiouridine synthesizing protein A